jgi:hypothetical protein
MSSGAYLASFEESVCDINDLLRNHNPKVARSSLAFTTTCDRSLFPPFATVMITLARGCAAL